MIQGELAFRARLYAPQPCIRQVLPDPDHDAVIRIGSEAPGGGPILESGVERHGLLRVATTSDRDRNRRDIASSGSTNFVAPSVRPLASRRRPALHRP